MEMGERIKELRKLKGLTQTELGELIGVQKAAVQKYENGNVKNLKRSRIKRLAEVLGVASSFLMYGEETIIDSIPTDDPIYLPIYGEVRAGVGGVVCEDLQGYLPAYKGTSKCFWLAVKGDSMYPRLFPGDHVLVCPQPDIENGQVAVVVINGEEGLVKRVQKANSGIILHSYNSLYEPREFYGEDLEEVRIIGLVIDMKAGKI